MRNLNRKTVAVVVGVVMVAATVAVWVVAGPVAASAAALCVTGLVGWLWPMPPDVRKARRLKGWFCDDDDHEWQEHQGKNVCSVCKLQQVREPSFVERMDCWSEGHDWHYVREDSRRCRRCGAQQKRHFDQPTNDWVDVS